jgi:hypothetical protein
MAITARELNVLRQAADVADAQRELVEGEKRRAEGNGGVGLAAPILATIGAALIIAYVSVLAVTSNDGQADLPVYLSGDIQPQPPRG